MAAITPNPGRAAYWLIMLFVAWPLLSMAMDAGDYLEDAQGYYDEGQYPAAVIQLKNALQSDPANRDARLLLGITYLKLENGPSALKELLRARELGVSREAVLVPLGQAYLMTAQSDSLFQAVTHEAGDSPRLKVDILLLHGQAYLQKNQLAMADERFSMVLELQPASAAAFAGKARIALQNRDTSSAAVYADSAIASNDQLVDAWVIKGQLLRSTGKQREALLAYQKALDIVPTSIPARLGMAMSLVGLGEQDNAVAEIERLMKRYPNLFVAHYVKALARYQQQQLTQAQESVQLALNQAPDHPASLLLSGAISFQLGQFNQSEQRLRQYLRQRPGDRQVAKLLAATLQKLGNPAAAIEVLEAGMNPTVKDAQYLALLGSAQLAYGEAASGLAYLEQAVALAPDAVDIRTQLAIAHLALGDEEQGIGELQSAVDLDQGLLQPDVLLVLAYLQKQDFDSALVSVEELMNRLPDSPVPHNLKGAAQFGKGDHGAARHAYEAALAIQAEFLPAYLNLAQLDLLANDSAAAKARYRKVLSYDEGNLKALLALAALARHEGQTAEAEQWLRQSHQHHPEAPQPALMLVAHYQREGNTLKALDLARKIAITHPRDQQVLKALALAQLQAGEDKAALATLRSWVDLAPESAEAHYQVALVQLKLENSAAARESLRQALALQADYPLAQLALGRLYITAGDFDAAMDVARNLQQAHPDAAYGYELEGDVLHSRQQFRQAAGLYTQAAGKTASAALVQKLFNSNQRAGDQDSANAVLGQWLAEHPEDIQRRNLLAVSLQSTGQHHRAIEEYLKVLELDANNVTALNNIAWLYQQAGNAEGLMYAERAHALVPDRVDVVDTLGWLLIQHGEISRGLVLLQDARARSPHVPDIHYHMAVALYKAGRSEEARKELHRLLKTGKRFADLENARALHNKLSNQ